jgi:hypothetical protein
MKPLRQARATVGCHPYIHATTNCCDDRLSSGLAASVGVVDELDVGAGAAPPERHPQRVEHERGAHVGGELPAHHLGAVVRGMDITYASWY